MAWSTPPRWYHGDTVGTANMQKYSDDLNFLYALRASGKSPVVLQQRHLNTGLDAKYNDATLTEAGIWVVHQFRWLRYRSISGSTATIVDPSGVNDNVSLPDQTSGSATFDMATVTWLVQGQLYKVTGVVFCMPDPEA